MIARTVRMILEDGTAAGVVKASVGNWNGEVLAAPRSRFPEFMNRLGRGQVGVYVLTGHDGNDGQAVYVGESDDLAKRLAQHFQDERKDFAQRFLAVYASDGSLSKSHVRWLEARLIRGLRGLSGIVLQNSQAPELPSLPDADRVDMEQFYHQMIEILPFIGGLWLAGAEQSPAPMAVPNRPSAQEYSGPVAETGAQPPASRDSTQPIFQLTRGQVVATGQPTDLGFRVLAGSTARAHHDGVSRDRGLRDRLVAEGVILPTENPDVLVFASDYVFSSPSTAGGVVLDANCSGPQTWRRPESGMTYKSWEESLVRKA